MSSGNRGGGGAAGENRLCPSGAAGSKFDGTTSPNRGESGGGGLCGGGLKGGGRWRARGRLTKRWQPGNNLHFLDDARSVATANSGPFGSNQQVD